MKKKEETLLTTSYLDKKLDDKLANYATKLDLTDMRNELVAENERIFGLYTEHIDHKFGIMMEAFQMTNEKLDREIIEIKNITKNHETRLVTLEAK